MFKQFVCSVLTAVAFAAAMPVQAAKIDPPKIAEDARNPPPSVALNTFQRFELAPIAMGAPWAGQNANEDARKNLQANIDQRANPVIAEWNAKLAGDAPRSLKIEPEIVYIRFITGGKRFFGGAFAGNSGVLLKLKFSDTATGEVVAEPQFYQRANAFSAAYTFGAMDKHMMIRASAMVADYLKQNYDTPVGGLVMVAPGHEEESDKK
jgi:hypothetical protein